MSRTVRIRPILAAGLVLLASACSSGGDSGNQFFPQTDANPSAEPGTPTSKGRPTKQSDAPPPNDADAPKKIKGIEVKPYNARNHVEAPKRVAYDQNPPFGGNHDANWATCSGVVYTKAVRNENMVHSLEHGAVWIAYNPDTLPKSGVSELAQKVEGVPYMVMSPYPGLDKPVSLQSWGHRLKLEDAADPRVDEFISALKLNKATFPEPGATCDNPYFDQDNPPPFESSPAPADAEPVGS
ncbi:hypothetical protein AOZ06_46520 [Kibdelosporangium phytohabitans]|uniref:DUF3105 domain-containing protein n=1 Tax=Kibdelosporangium phytohabitans TaxID=860235 RepID=A0A0N9IEX9_9PSEU|nr:hypothetical protein AOZ06_46520 [Kibdelosporangium phytohabitans]